MNWIKRVMVLALIALWALASNHCLLERVPGLAFLACCVQEDGAVGPDQDCDTDGCAAVENQLYKAELTQVSIPAPVFLATFVPVPLVEASSSPASPASADLAPISLSRIWQFSYRTALSPRAPSLPS